MKTLRERFLVWLICVCGAMYLVAYGASHGNLGPLGLAILAFLLATCAVGAFVLIIRKSRKDTLEVAPAPGTPIDETTRRQRLRTIRSGKVAIAFLAGGLIFSLFQGFPILAVVVGGLIDLGVIAVIIQVIVRLKRGLD